MATETISIPRRSSIKKRSCMNSSPHHRPMSLLLSSPFAKQSSPTTIDLILHDEDEEDLGRDKLHRLSVSSASGEDTLPRHNTPLLDENTPLLKRHTIPAISDPPCVCGSDKSKHRLLKGLKLKLKPRCKCHERVTTQSNGIHSSNEDPPDSQDCYGETTLSSFKSIESFETLNQVQKVDSHDQKKDFKTFDAAPRANSTASNESSNDAQEPEFITAIDEPSVICASPAELKEDCSSTISALSISPQSVRKVVSFDSNVQVHSHDDWELRLKSIRMQKKTQTPFHVCDCVLHRSMRKLAHAFAACTPRYSAYSL